MPNPRLRYPAESIWTGEMNWLEEAAGVEKKI
jgi:hypothetical protein